jgi:lysophospholipase L1-like esterase
MHNDSKKPGRGTAVALLVVLAAVGGFGFVVATQGFAGPSAASPTSVSRVTAAQSVVSPSSVASAAPVSTGPSLAPPTAPPSSGPVPLPALLGAIGDSYSQAWSVSPANRGDHSEFSWVVGTSADDGVFSVLERFRALGASPQVVDAATSGVQMKDAVRQANKVVAAAKSLKPGQTAYVTFELGTNDLCASPEPLTAPATFQAQLQDALAILRAGLPTESRILVLAVPNMPHLHDITQADPAANALLARTSIQSGCPPYLGNSNYMPFDTADGFLSQYDAALQSACAGIESGDGGTGRLHCTYNADLLAESDFVIGDLSTYDYFHPSLRGQAKMAANAWAADIWGWTLLGAGMPPIAGAASEAGSPWEPTLSVLAVPLGRRFKLSRRATESVSL